MYLQAQCYNTIVCSVLTIPDMQPGYSTTIQSDCGTARHAYKYDAAVSVYTTYNDSHWNALKYQIDSQAPENTSHFAMRITLFSSLLCALIADGTMHIRIMEKMTQFLLMMLITLSPPYYLYG